MTQEGEKDLHRFLRNLEEAIIETCVGLGVVGAGRKPGATGVWVDEEKKIASIGIACRRWVTFHGLALNVSTDLAYFSRINPCGFESRVMTSGSEMTGRSVSVAEARELLAPALGRSLNRRLRAR